MSKHTPGPWHLCGDDRGGCSCNTVTSPDYPIAKVTLGEWGDEWPSLRLTESSMAGKYETYMEKCTYGEVSKETAVANARLIAAAPDMLAALTMALHDYTLNDSAARVVEAAIAKAVRA